MAVQRTARLLLLITLLLDAAAFSGCRPVFSPPIRSISTGAPRQLSDGTIEVGGATNLYLSGGPWVSIPVARRTSLDLGSDLRLMDSGGWVLGTAGLRYTFGGSTDGGARGFLADLELGGGIGVGGSHETEEDRGAFQRVAYGAYAGVGLSYQLVRWLGWFMRGRLEVSKAAFIPVTLWTSGVSGPQVTLGPVTFYLACGVAYYANSLDHELGLLPEVGLAVRFKAF